MAVDHLSVAILYYFISNNNLSNKFKITADNGYTQLSQLMDVGAWSEPFVFDIPYTSSLAPASNNAVGIAERGMLHAFDYAGKHFYCIDASKGWQKSPYALKSDLSWKTLGTVSNTETLDISNITKTANEICIVVYFLIDKNERDYFYIIPVAGLGSGGSVVTIGGYYITAGDYGVVQVRASTSEIGLVTVYHGGQDVRSKASLKVRYR